jgi:molybdopterin converting factor small subunit
MTRLTVLMFARARELVDASSVVVDLLADADGGATVADARAALLEKFPQLESVLLTSLFALNQSYVDRAREDATTVSENDELAVVPPISGG